MCGPKIRLRASLTVDLKATPALPRIEVTFQEVRFGLQSQLFYSKLLPPLSDRDRSRLSDSETPPGVVGRSRFGHVPVTDERSPNASSIRWHKSIAISGGNGSNSILVKRCCRSFDHFRRLVAFRPIAFELRFAEDVIPFCRHSIVLIDVDANQISAGWNWLLSGIPEFLRPLRVAGGNCKDHALPEMSLAGDRVVRCCDGRLGPPVTLPAMDVGSQQFLMKSLREVDDSQVLAGRSEYELYGCGEILCPPVFLVRSGSVVVQESPETPVGLTAGDELRAATTRRVDAMFSEPDDEASRT